MLRKPGLPEEPTLPHGASAHRHPLEEAASGNDGLLLRADEVHHRGQGTSELRPASWIQRKVTFDRNGNYKKLVVTNTRLCLAVRVRFNSNGLVPVYYVL